MKRILIILLAVILTFSLVACGSETQLNTDDKASTSQNESDAESNNGSNTSTNESPADTNEIENNEISFTEAVAVDNTECLIKITEIDPDNMWGYTLKVQLENKSVEKTYMFSVESASINGVQYDPFFATEVAAGKKANDEICFSNDVIEENNIGNYTDIELTFRVYDSEDWLADEVAIETVHIYPYGEDAAKKFVRESKPTDNVIIDNENVTVVVTGYEIDEIWGYTVNLFLINKSDKNVMFSVEDASVNGYMADPFYAKSVSSGKCAFSSMSWSDTTLEENSITDIEIIEFVLRAYDEEDWLTEDFANETISLNP